MLHFGVEGKPSELDAVLLLRKGKRKEVRLKKKKKKFGEAVSALEPKLLVRKICWLSERELC